MSNLLLTEQMSPFLHIRRSATERGKDAPSGRSAVASKSPVRIPPRFEGERWIPLQLSIIRYSRSLASIPISFVSIASIPMFVRLSVYPSASVPRPKSVLPLPPPKHARSLGACPLSCCNGATRSVGHSFYRFFAMGPVRRLFPPVRSSFRPLAAPK